MNTPNSLLSFLYLLLLFHLSGDHGVDGCSEFKPKSIFAFGDSYADTGNIAVGHGESWKKPYGITYPGEPSGRFSDGRVSTDYVASFLGIRSPVAYQFRDSSSPENLKNGMNFAFGGAGVFDTIYGVPNTTLQLDFFEDMIRRKIYSAADLDSSVALLSIAGNDYTTYSARNGTAKGQRSFTTRLVNQMVLNMKRIHRLGVRKVLVPEILPAGCLPPSTAPLGFQRCNETTNLESQFHNRVLRQATARLNRQINKYDTTFVLLDLYSAFFTVLENKENKFEQEIYRPCCVGLSSGDKCGSVDKSGALRYRLCKDPKTAFFWDIVHPTQQAWSALYSILLSNLTLS